LGTFQPDGSWPDINYQDRSASGWKTVRHLSNVATLARAYRSYLVVPGIAADTLATYVGRSPVKILRNAPSLQAVWHERLRTAGLAFYEPGEVEIRPGLTVVVDAPCLALLKESPEKLLNFLEVASVDPAGQPARSWRGRRSAASSRSTCGMIAGTPSARPGSGPCARSSRTSPGR
jgi:Polysaccharide lyase family 8, C-terminal beta-sandwich domain